ncbi:MAG: hypothetical protein M3Y71_08320, partial [Actinomycetota bacterium]|nr:hypothetical protein [Actinomycetota bacterium]
VPPAAAPATGGAATLPADTMVALQLGGLGDTVQRAWPHLGKAIPGGTGSLTDVERRLGVRLPDDLVTLLGSSITVSMPKQDLTALDSGLPTVGLKVVTTEAGRADSLVTGLSTSLGADGVVKHQVADGSLLLATSDAYLASLQQKGSLGSSSLFTKAVATPDTAASLLFADLGPLRPLYAGRTSSDLEPLLTSLTAIGLSATPVTDGGSSFALRVVGQ